MSNNLRAAFQNWSAQLGIVMTVAGLMSFLARTLSISLWEPVRVLVQAFRTLFHPIVELPLSLFGIEASEPIKDVALIWMAIGGAVGRTITALYATNTQGRQFFVTTNIGRLLNYFAESAFRRTLLTLASVIIWPVLLFFGLHWPVVVTRGDAMTILPSRRTLPDGAIVCDLRAILLIHLATITVATVALVVASTLGR